MCRLLFLFLLATRLSAQETMIREVYDTKTDSNVEVLALFSKPSPGGFMPVRVKLSNNLKNDRAAYLNFESTTNYSSGSHTASEFDFQAPAGKSVTQDILVPICPAGTNSDWSQLTVRLGGSLGEGSNQMSSSSDGKQPAVLLSEALFTPNASSLDGALTSTSRYGGKTEFAAKFDPKQLPDSWLAFSGYDSVIMTDLDWTNTPSSSRNAILSWVRNGGQLVIFTTGSGDLKSMGIHEEASYGSILLRTIPNDLKLDPKATIALVSKDNPNKPRDAALKNDFDGRWPLQNHFGAQTFRYGLFIAVLILFAIIVGPVNLFVFAKSGQRHKLFITTPIISLAASALLIALIIIQDGFGGSGARRVLMEVRPDGDQNAAYIHQEQFCRTGVLTGSRFTIPELCDFSPVPIAASRWARFTSSSAANGTYNLQPQDGKLKVSGDWFQSRSEHGHSLTTVISTRGRIERTDNPLALVSTFDFPIESLFYHAADGQWFRANQIATGKRFTLTPVDAAMVVPVLKKEITTYSDRNRDILKRVSERRNCYVALTGEAPGVPTHPGIRWKETRTVITGPVL